MRQRERLRQPHRVARGAGSFQLGEHVVAMPDPVRPFSGETHAQPPCQRVTRRKSLERLTLQGLDTRVVERRAVLVHPDPAEPESHLSQSLAVSVGAGCLSLLPQGFTGFAEAASLEQGHPGP